MLNKQKCDNLLPIECAISNGNLLSFSTSLGSNLTIGDNFAQLSQFCVLRVFRGSHTLVVNGPIPYHDQHNH